MPAPRALTVMARMPKKSGEFELIARYFAPLAAGAAGAFALSDDAALVDLEPGQRLVVTTDVLVAGVHFRSEEAPGDIAAKALRVNLSDLAAMGARPRAYLLGLALPESIDDSWIERFAGELAGEQARFGLALVGGDTVATGGPLTVAVTALGEVAEGRVLRRRGASVGDRVYVSGTIGDAALGLELVKGRLAGAALMLDDTETAALIARYLRPEPRLALGGRLAGLASAAIDVSDGLVADLEHICEVSGFGAVVRAAALPLSEAAGHVLDAEPALRATVLSGGDDYELLFTAPEARAAEAGRLSADTGVAVTEIGEIVEGQGVRVVDESGRDITPARTGYRHF